MSSLVPDSPGSDGQRPLTLTLLVGTLALVGVGAMGGGAAFLIDTSGAAAGMDVTVLSRSPFRSYLWPGVMLVGLLALPSGIIAWGLVRQPSWAALSVIEASTGHHWSWASALAYGVGLMVWIVVQVMLIERSFLQPLLFAVGVVIVVLAVAPSVRRVLRLPVTSRD